MYGRRYQWIIVGMYQERWWEVRDQNTTCTTWELTQAMEGLIATDVLPLSSSENITVSGLFDLQNFIDVFIHLTYCSILLNYDAEESLLNYDAEEKNCDAVI
ncbi:hypothetical protein CEXT_746371 [Caerostris extrusa]|uniref:Uncharacterized protein n=1 Tax=Caerostris extrusa TaxID=172846 RepID=A0AAV4M804_CAEEX|nr:hypothetical protein CEXT_746371 [Caerostris extrusa]